MYLSHWWECILHATFHEITSAKHSIFSIRLQYSTFVCGKVKQRHTHTHRWYTFYMNRKRETEAYTTKYLATNAPISCFFSSVSCVYIFLNSMKMKKKVCCEHVALILFVCSFSSASLPRSTVLSSSFFFLCFLFAFSFIFFLSVVGFDSLTFVQCVFHFVCLEFYSLSPHVNRLDELRMEKKTWKWALNRTWHSIQPEKFHSNWMTIFLWLVFFSCFIRGRIENVFSRGNLAEIEWFIWIELIYTLHNTARLLI